LLDLTDQPRQRPVVAIRDRRRQQQLGDPQRGFGFDRGRAHRHARLQRLDAAPREIAAPQPHRILAHAERLRDARAGPARQRQ
jgi:hypothetical protein